jgi:hypothetical protein
MTPFEPLSGVAIAVYGLILLTLVILVIPIVLARKAGSIEAFFGIPYITWYLLHYTIATVGILAVAILGLVGALNATAIAALLGGLFGYVLGAASRSQNAASNSGGAGATPIQHGQGVAPASASTDGDVSQPGGSDPA